MCPYRPIPYEQLVQIPIRTPEDAIAAIHHLTGYRPKAGTVTILTTRDQTPLALANISVERARTPVSPDAVREFIESESEVIIVGWGRPVQMLEAVATIGRYADTPGTPLAHLLCATGEHYWPLSPRGGSSAQVAYQLRDSAFDRDARRTGSDPSATPEEQLARWISPISDDQRARVRHAEATARHLLRVLDAVLPVDRPESIGYLRALNLRALIESAALARQDGPELTPDDAAPILALLDDHRMREMLLGFYRLPSTGIVTGVACDLARYASAAQRGPALAFVAYAALIDGERFVAQLAIEGAKYTGREDPTVEYIGDLLTTHCPEPDDAALDDAVATLVAPPTAVYRLPEVLHLAEAAFQRMDASPPSQRNPELVISWDASMTCGASSAVGTRIAALEVQNRHTWPSAPAQFQIPLTDDLVETLHDGAARAVPQVSVAFRGMGRMVMRVTGPSAASN